MWFLFVFQKRFPTDLVDLGATLGATSSEWAVFNPLEWLEIVEKYQMEGVSLALKGRCSTT
jgi:hypothetical protein